MPRGPLSSRNMRQWVQLFGAAWELLQWEDCGWSRQMHTETSALQVLKRRFSFLCTRQCLASVGADSEQYFICSQELFHTLRGIVCIYGANKAYSYCFPLYKYHQSTADTKTTVEMKPFNQNQVGLIQTWGKMRFLYSQIYSSVWVSSCSRILKILFIKYKWENVR